MNDDSIHRSKMKYYKNCDHCGSAIWQIQERTYIKVEDFQKEVYEEENAGLRLNKEERVNKQCLQTKVSIITVF